MNSFSKKLHIQIETTKPEKFLKIYKNWEEISDFLDTKGKLVFYPLIHPLLSEEDREHINNSLLNNWEKNEFEDFDWETWIVFTYFEDTWNYLITILLNIEWGDFKHWINKVYLDPDSDIIIYLADPNPNDIKGIARYSKDSNNNLDTVFFSYWEFEFFEESWSHGNYLVLINDEINKNDYLYDLFNEIFSILYWEAIIYSNKEEYARALERHSAY